MEFYLAPLEGVTGYLYRNALHDFFGNEIKRYFTPFITPHTKRSFNAKERGDLLPEHNKGMEVIPQVLTNNATEFLKIQKDIMEEFGYEILNINLGCPSGTVASKGRGAGFLSEPKKLDAFLQEIFENTKGRISIKTRIGTEEPEEFFRLLEIYNQYPLEELIIHPRVLTEFYKGNVHEDMFIYAMQHSKNPLCYNGDIFAKEDYNRLSQKFTFVSPKTEMLRSVMLGRGVMANPGLIREIATGKSMSKEEFICFHERILKDYSEVLSGDKNVLFKMKELWAYMIWLFEDADKYMKKIRKSERLCDYRIAVDSLLYNRDIRNNAAYHRDFK